MAFVTEIVLFRARPGIAAEIAVQTVVEEAGRPATAGPDAAMGREAGCCMQVIDGPGVRPYHWGSRSL